MPGKRREGMWHMRLRGQELGVKNLIGARVEFARKNLNMKQKELLAQLQVRGVDLTASALSKLEGQLRYATDIELLALADILSVSVMWLLTGEEGEKEPKFWTALNNNAWRPQASLCIFLALRCHSKTMARRAALLKWGLSVLLVS